MSSHLPHLPTGPRSQHGPCASTDVRQGSKPPTSSRSSHPNAAGRSPGQRGLIIERERYRGPSSCKFLPFGRYRGSAEEGGASGTGASCLRASARSGRDARVPVHHRRAAGPATQANDKQRVGFFRVRLAPDDRFGFCCRIGIHARGGQRLPPADQMATDPWLNGLPGAPSGSCRSPRHTSSLIFAV